MSSHQCLFMTCKGEANQGTVNSPLISNENIIYYHEYQFMGSVFKEFEQPDLSVA